MRASRRSVFSPFVRVRGHRHLGLGLGKLPPQDQGEGPVAQSRRDQDPPHPQTWPQQAPGPGGAAPRQGHQNQHAPKGAGQHQKQRPPPQQPVRRPIRRQQHPRRRQRRAHRMAQSAQPRQQGQHPIACPQSRRQGQPTAANGAPIQPGGAGQQAVVHRQVQGKAGVQIDGGHGLPPLVWCFPSIRRSGFKKGQKRGAETGFAWQEKRERPPSVGRSFPCEMRE